jgi:hypothetical protein
LLLDKIFDPWRFIWKFSTEAFILDSSVDRYHLIEFFINEGILGKKNLEGKVVDIGCHIGATVDALAMYGGNVVGTDCGKYAYESPSGRDIARMEGRWLVQSYASRMDKPNLISCFNVGWVEDMSHKGFAVELCNDSLISLAPNGQVLYTFSDKDLGSYEKLSEFSDSKLVRIPNGLDIREKYAFTCRKMNAD